MKKWPEIKKNLLFSIKKYISIIHHSNLSLLSISLEIIFRQQNRIKLTDSYQCWTNLSMHNQMYLNPYLWEHRWQHWVRLFNHTLWCFCIEVFPFVVFCLFRARVSQEGNESLKGYLWKRGGCTWIGQEWDIDSRRLQPQFDFNWSWEYNGR